MSESGLHGEGEFWLEEYGQAKYLGGGMLHDMAGKRRA